MDVAALLETASVWLCSAQFLLWMMIATLSRTDRSEDFAQWFMVAISLVTALALVLLDFYDGSIWGSTYAPKPLALLCIVFAAMARLNIKGRNVSQGMNPHQIMREKREAEE